MVYLSGPPGGFKPNLHPARAEDSPQSQVKGSPCSPIVTDNFCLFLPKFCYLSPFVILGPVALSGTKLFAFTSPNLHSSGQGKKSPFKILVTKPTAAQSWEMHVGGSFPLWHSPPHIIWSPTTRSGYPKTKTNPLNERGVLKPLGACCLPKVFSPITESRLRTSWEGPGASTSETLEFLKMEFWTPLYFQSHSLGIALHCLSPIGLEKSKLTFRA